MSPSKQISAIVGSKNPVKISAAKLALATVFPDAEIICDGISAPSNVPDQPMTETETREGAINRLRYCQKKQPTADYYFAMEGGVDNFSQGPATFAFVAISDQNNLSIGRSTNLPLPKQVFEALQQGEELGHVMDRLFNTENVKQKGGAIGLLTNGHATRQSIYSQAIILAMAPFLHPDLYDFS